MRTTGANRQDILDRLQEAAVQGYSWVVANNNREILLEALDLRFFESATEAMEICPVWSAWQTPGLCHDEVYRAEPVANVIRQLEQCSDQNAALLRPLEFYYEMFRAKQVLPMDGYWDNDLLNVIRNELIFPVQWEITIVPSQHLRSFQVTEHLHDGGMIYEQGHSFRELGKFPTYERAKSFMDEATVSLQASGKRHDLVLLGQYDPDILAQDMEGYPLWHTGLVLETANAYYDADLRAMAFNRSIIHEVDQPLGVTYFLYAVFDLQQDRLVILNDKLKETELHLGLVSTFPEYFNYTSLTNKSKHIMNEKNYDYLKNQVKFAGFGEGLDKELREMIETGRPDFKLQHQTKFGGDEVSSTLHFKKGKESEMYFFNSYDLTLKQAGKEEVLNQTYFVGQENNLTLKERYNMLDGRAVFKEFNKLEQVGEGADARFKATDQTYKAWTELKFKETDDQGNFVPRKMFGFDLDKTLAKYPIKELEDAYDKSRLIASLEKGNVQFATLVVDGAESRIAIAANPRENGLDFYDSNMQRLESKQIPVVKREQHEKQELGATKDQADVVQSKGAAQDKKVGVEGSTTEKASEETKRKSMKIS